MIREKLKQFNLNLWVGGLLLKSKIIKDLVENKVSIEQTLTRVKLINNDLKIGVLEDWVNSELFGYNGQEELPEYRIARHSNLRYSGINGNIKIQNNPLPLVYVPEQWAEILIKTEIKESILVIENICNQDNYIIQDFSFLASEFNLEGNILFTKIIREVPITIFLTVINFVKNRLLDVLIELENSFGNLDDLDIPNDLITPEAINSLEKKLVFDNGFIEEL